MPRFDQMSEGKYLKKEDFPQPALLTIKAFTRENVARDNEPPEFKWTVHFNEVERGLVLNQTNLQLLQLATGCVETESAIGKKVVLYNDPTVSMAGKLTGGVRIRAPRNQPAPLARPAPPVEPEPTFPGEGPDDSNVPF